MKHRHNTRGFTLIELLVVIALLFVVAGMFLPCGHPAREKARRINCAGNQKQMGLALRMYAGDYLDVFPDGVGAYDDSVGLNLLVERGYMSAMKVYICPSTTTTTASATYLTTQSCTYEYQSGHTELTADKTVSITRDYATNHTRFGNLLFGDGHVKGYSGADWLTNSNF